MSNALLLAILALTALSSVACESMRTPTAAEISVLNEMQPMRRRVSDVERHLEGKADRQQVEQVGQVAQRADQGALKARQAAQRAGETAEGAGRKLADLEVANRRTESELRAEIDAVKKSLQSQTAHLSGLEERLAVVEQISREPREQRERARTAPTPRPPATVSREVQSKLRTETVLTQVKSEAASLAGLSTGQLEHVDLAGFLSGSADISPVIEADPRAREQVEALKRLIAEGRAEIVQIVSFEDTVPCRRAEQDCRTIAFRRGLNTASYLRAPKGAVDAREPTDRWGPPAENRRVIVLYMRKSPTHAGPAPGPARPPAPSAPAAAAPATARPR
jgi:hypothetical protein